jgi:hypothetical protein
MPRLVLELDVRTRPEASFLDPQYVLTVGYSGTYTTYRVAAGS